MKILPLFYLIIFVFFTSCSEKKEIKGRLTAKEISLTYAENYTTVNIDKKIVENIDTKKSKNLNKSSIGNFKFISFGEVFFSCEIFGTLISYYDKNFNLKKKRDVGGVGQGHTSSVTGCIVLSDSSLMLYSGERNAPKVILLDKNLEFVEETSLGQWVEKGLPMGVLLFYYALPLDKKKNIFVMAGNRLNDFHKQKNSELFDNIFLVDMGKNRVLSSFKAYQKHVLNLFYSGKYKGKQASKQDIFMSSAFLGYNILATEAEKIYVSNSRLPQSIFMRKYKKNLPYLDTLLISYNLPDEIVRYRSFSMRQEESYLNKKKWKKWNGFPTVWEMYVYQDKLLLYYSESKDLGEEKKYQRGLFVLDVQTNKILKKNIYDVSYMPIAVKGDSLLMIGSKNENDEKKNVVCLPFTDLI